MRCDPQLHKTLFLTLAVAALHGPVWAAPAEQPQDVSVTIKEMNGSGELLRLPVNKTVLLSFSETVAEVRTLDEALAEVTALKPNQVLVRGLSFGTTQLVVAFDSGVNKVYDLAVDLELDRLVASLRTTAPQARVEAHALLNAVVLTGTAPNTEAAARIVEIAQVFSPQVINHIRIAGGQQVMLRVVVAEVNRTATRQLGFNGWIAGSGVPSAFGLSNIGGINPSNIGATGGSIVSPPQALGPAANAAAGGIVPFRIADEGIPVTAATTLSVGFPEVPMQIFVQALRENGLLRVLAEPNLISMSGQAAEFLAGGSFPIPVPQGDDQISITFQDFGVLLNFTPTVLAEERIRLQVAPSVSEPDNSNAVSVAGFFVPGLVERRVQTTVEVGNGETLAIGGLLSERVRAISSKVPALGDIPVLGALFRSVEYQSEETELVVLVTPELVGGISPQQVAHIPGADSFAPNDFELYLEGRLEGRGPGAQPKLTPHVNRNWQTPPNADYESPMVMKLRGPVGPAGGADGK